MYCYYKKVSVQTIPQFRLRINKFVATNLQNFAWDKSSFCALQNTTPQGLQSQPFFYTSTYKAFKTHLNINNTAHVTVVLHKPNSCDTSKHF